MWCEVMANDGGGGKVTFMMGKRGRSFWLLAYLTRLCLT